MDLTQYDEHIQDLIRDCLTKTAVLSPDAPRAIRRLKSAAKKLGDDRLLGIAGFREATYVYYTSDDNTAFRPLLNSAARAILRSGDKELLSRLYNFLAVDAHNYGCFDVAYNYYMMSLHFSETDSDPVSSAIGKANIARLFAELEEPAQARRYLRMSLKDMRRMKKDPGVRGGILVLLANDGLVSLLLKDTAAAKKNLEKLDAAIAKLPEEEAEELKMPRAFLDIQLLLATGKRAAIRQSMKQFAQTLHETPALQEYCDDICSLCHTLIREKLYPEAGMILEAANDKIMSSDNTYLKHTFCDLKSDYYEACGDEQRIIDCMREQRSLSVKLRGEQRLLHRFSVELSALISELQAEQRRVRRENAVLQVQAQTDALTGIPNRYIMNRELEAAFERAWRGRYPLGLAIIDIDYFKEYNDTYGHPAGDSCLSLIAHALTELAAADGIFCARYGGDEFVILYENMSDAAIRRHAKKLEQRIRSFKIAHKASPIDDHITVSQGICNHVPRKKNKPWDFLTVADIALYEVKKNRSKGKKRSSIRFKRMSFDA